MKKILFTLLSLLCCMTAAWAGEGDGTKERPFTGEWLASELGPKLEPGQYLSFDCVIMHGGTTVIDTKLNNQEVAKNWPTWAPGNLIDNPQDGSPYKNYGADNPRDSRKKQSFILTDVSPSAKTSTSFTIKGYFSGFYRGVPEADGFYNVYTAKQMRTVLQAAANAKVRLTEDIYLSENEGDNTFCSTFSGILDGNGHTFYGGKDGTRQNRNYLFTNSNGATFKNLTFKNLRKNSEDHPNQAILTSKAMNHCVFDNIMFDNVGTWSNHDNAAAAAGWAQDCSFTNITVKNSDFTTDDNQAGTVVAHAISCSFKNIKIENCKTYSDAGADGYGGKSGGVVARADYCTFLNCFVDSKTSVYSESEFCGGIVGYAVGCNIKECTNCAIVASGNNNLIQNYHDIYIGGIVGYVEKDDAKTITTIESCINAGIMFNATKENFESIAEKYKQSGYNPSTIPFAGKTYTIQQLDQNTFNDKLRHNGQYGGGIVGRGKYCRITNCTNLSPMHLSYYAGAIAGSLDKSSIECCVNYGNHIILSGTSVGLYLSGAILGDCNDETSITNCLNVGGGGHYNYIVGGFGSDCSVKNCLNTIGEAIRDNQAAGSGGIEVNNYDKNNTTPEKLASGEICLKLGAAWEQNLGTDPYPTPTGNKGLYFASELYSEFNSICLPFAVNSDEKVQCYKPQSAGYSEDKTIYYIKLAPVDGLLAGEPGFCRVLEPGSTYTFGKADGESYQFTPQEYDIPVEPSASGDDPDMSWTMSGALQGPSTFHNDTNYGNIDRRMMYSEMVWANAAYIKGPSYINTFTDGNPVNGTPIYIVSSTSPYDVNFDDEVNVGDVISFIGMDDNFTPFVSGSREDNLRALSETILVTPHQE